MRYSHQAQLSEISELPALGEPPVTFWSGNLRHAIAVQDGGSWSLLESSGSLVGEFVSEDAGFAVVDDENGERERFETWRSAVRHILRRGLRAA
ncbi:MULTISPECIES: hypothetical protein [Microbacteriaceae]|jgi:hypothetical protein|uniref:hypothetical protein n=1 Tax=Microbacteriaceae TaxID=85023 RepID=UPI0033973886